MSHTTTQLIDNQTPHLKLSLLWRRSKLDLKRFVKQTNLISVALPRFEGFMFESRDGSSERNQENFIVNTFMSFNSCYTIPALCGRIDHKNNDRSCLQIRRERKSLTSEISKANLTTDIVAALKYPNRSDLLLSLIRIIGCFSGTV